MIFAGVSGCHHNVNNYLKILILVRRIIQEISKEPIIYSSGSICIKGPAFFNGWLGIKLTVIED